MMQKRIKAISLFLFFTVIIGSVVLLYQVIRGYNAIKTQTGLSALSLYQLATDGEAMVKSDNGRVNILLLGVGGGTHEGPDLTDTIIVVSFHLTQKTLSLISIPRDIWSDSLRDKVNSAYHYGEEKKEDGGLTLSSIIIEDVIGIPIHYAMVIDFSQFESLIDYIGGIDVEVPAAFIDTEYPIAGKEEDPCDGDPMFLCRYQTVTFEKGMQHMNGKRALMYVRSRHADGEEGTDFALDNSMEIIEKGILLRTLGKFEFNQSRTARFLKMTEDTLRYRMKKLGIPTARKQ